MESNRKELLNHVEQIVQYVKDNEDVRFIFICECKKGRIVASGADNPFNKLHAVGLVEYAKHELIKEVTKSEYENDGHENAESFINKMLKEAILQKEMMQAEQSVKQ